MTITFKQKPLNTVNWLKERPIAHRGLHNAVQSVFENTLCACRAAMEAGYNIEVDLQPSSETVPMVFHDYTLDRLTERSGDIREVTSDELQTIKVGNSYDTIPTLDQLLDLIQGKVGIILELKGKAGSDDGFVAAIAQRLAGYKGDVAIMSFAHHILEDARRVAPDLILGLTAEGDETEYETHQSIIAKTNPDFVSYELAHLDCRFAQEFRQTGYPMISWTVRSPADKVRSDKYADQPTFEGFTA